MKNKSQRSAARKAISEWQERSICELMQIIDELVAEKDNEIAVLKKELDDKTANLDLVYQSVQMSGTWEDRFLLFTTNKKFLYDYLYDKLESYEKEKPNLYRSLLARFPFMPQISKNELQDRKRRGLLQPQQEEVYDAINKFCSFKSDSKNR